MVLRAVPGLANSRTYDGLTRNDDIKAIHRLKQCWPCLASSLQYIMPAALAIWVLMQTHMDSTPGLELAIRWLLCATTQDYIAAAVPSDTRCADGAVKHKILFDPTDAYDLSWLA